MRILVCGGRDFKDEHAVVSVLMEYDPDTTILIEGGAAGADRYARAHALRAEWLAIWSFPASWKRLGTAAGPIRNKAMLECGKPHLVIAFPGGRGTAHMVQIAKQAGVPVRIIE